MTIVKLLVMEMIMLAMKRINYVDENIFELTEIGFSEEHTFFINGSHPLPKQMFLYILEGGGVKPI